KVALPKSAKCRLLIPTSLADHSGSPALRKPSVICCRLAEDSYGSISTHSRSVKSGCCLSHSDQALLQAAHHQCLPEAEADEDQPTFPLVALGPRRAGVMAHQLMDALEDHPAVVSGHVKHALVAQEILAAAGDDGVHELAEAHPVERPFRAEDKTLHVVVVVMVMLLGFVIVIVGGGARRGRFELQIGG